MPRRRELNCDPRPGQPYVGDKVTEAIEAARQGEVTWLLLDGQVIAAIIAAADVHEPGQCCCKNCPWGGHHG